MNGVAADVEALKEGTRGAWSRDDYGQLAKLFEGAARELLDACAISAGQEVVDVGAGNGNLAVLAAREGASVVACDLTPAMVELGRARSEAEGLAVEWLVADAEELPFEDARFDCAGSVFGAMFAPRPERAAAELLRVVRPGGTVGMASWTPDSYQGLSFEIGRRYMTAPGALPTSTDWGEETIARARFESLGARVEASRRSVPFRFASPEAMSSFFGRNAGPVVAAREAMSAERYREMGEETKRLAADRNLATDGSMAIDVDYLLVVARKRR